ncbi:SsgA family sporulation/cell division regulator [Nocardioides sp. YIM 152315]|uniref:SsgA family sporulation/cell division regulator n=1 Tax=Nocardioides sp. YIM 152315 TaxID=3031760 RepID=UPI0023DB88AB|nr:SsgA family sporulation/cell division regulator [Nocardioides sp. YIM 152315]MDF1605567.1 SsgA family sporulation/cell division regulator [Nocardioides sp. YIM 152315]
MNQQSMPRRLSQDVTLQCLDARGRSIDLPALLAYDPTDPWAVEFTFGRPSGTVRWLIGRDLLLSGMTDPAGEGDVLAWPSIDEYGRAAVVLEFSSPHGRLVTQLSTRDLGSFLTRTLTVVPRGEERIDLDLLVESLTGSQTQ